MDERGLPTPRFERLAPGADVRAAALRLGLPVFVKPSSEGSSVGVARVADEAGIDEAVRVAREYGGEMLMEEMVVGDELTVGILGDVALPSIRIVPKQGWYDYNAKYLADDTQYPSARAWRARTRRDPRARAGRVPRRRPAAAAGAAST